MYTKCFTCATQSLDEELQKVLQSIDQVTYRIVDIKLSTAAYLGATVIVMYTAKS
jgi:hypothetical protein